MPPKSPNPVFRSGRWNCLAFAPRRANHGLPRPAEEMGQPQDGISAWEASTQAEASRSALREPEDARLTGGTRSLMRRVLGLNVIGASLPRSGRPQPARSLKGMVQPATAA